jgi:hypothetical protein
MPATLVTLLGDSNFRSWEFRMFEPATVSMTIIPFANIDCSHHRLLLVRPAGLVHCRHDAVDNLSGLDHSGAGPVDGRLG